MRSALSQSFHLITFSPNRTGGSMFQCTDNNEGVAIRVPESVCID